MSSPLGDSDCKGLRQDNYVDDLGEVRLVYSLRHVMSTIRSHDVSLHSSHDSHDVTMNNMNPHDLVMNIVKGVPFWDSQWQEDDQHKK